MESRVGAQRVDERIVRGRAREDGVRVIRAARFVAGDAALSSRGIADECSRTFAARVDGGAHARVDGGAHARRRKVWLLARRLAVVGVVMIHEANDAARANDAAGYALCVMRYVLCAMCYVLSTAHVPGAFKHHRGGSQVVRIRATVERAEVHFVVVPHGGKKGDAVRATGVDRGAHEIAR